jgi:alpha-mannosidase II
LEVNDKKIFKLMNRFLSISFSKTGSLLSIQHLKHDEKILFTTNVIRYGTSTEPDHNSGAYLFLPDGEAKDIPMGNHDLVRIQRGPLVSRVDILHEMYGLQYKLTNING